MTENSQTPATVYVPCLADAVDRFMEVVGTPMGFTLVETRRVDPEDPEDLRVIVKCTDDPSDPLCVEGTPVTGWCMFLPPTAHVTDEHVLYLFAGVHDAYGEDMPEGYGSGRGMTGYLVRPLYGDAAPAPDEDGVEVDLPDNIEDLLNRLTGRMQ